MNHPLDHEIAAGHGRGKDAVLAEVLDALEMPPSGLRVWLEKSKSFCRRHGGRRRYGELMDLYDDCLAALDHGAR